MAGRDRRRFFLRLAVSCAGSLFSARAGATNVDLGASAGGFLAGSVPRFSISPYITISMPAFGDSFSVGVNEMASLLLAAGNRGPGFYNHLTAFGALTWKDGKLVLGPTLALFAMPACGPTWCGNLRGFGAGGSVRIDLFEKPLGASLGCNVDVPIKSTALLPSGPAVMFFAGGVFRVL